MNNASQDSNIPSKSPVLKMFLVVAAVGALAAANAHIYLKLDHLGKDVSEWRKSMLAEITQLRETQSTGMAAQSSRLDSLAEQIGAASQQAASVASRSKNEIKRTAEQIARLSEQQQKQQQQLAHELTQVKEAASSVNTKIDHVSSQVTSVKSDVATARTELEKTVSDLKRVTGDMGVMSGLIATNAKELAALRQLGERNYFEFSLTKAKTPYRVGDISVLVKKTDPKRNKFAIELYADDKRVEKKDRTINEPVQFYVSGSRLPYEIVVNEVKPDRIVGYLATPKTQMARK